MEQREVELITYYGRYTLRILPQRADPVCCVTGARTEFQSNSTGKMHSLPCLQCQDFH